MVTGFPIWRHVLSSKPLNSKETGNPGKTDLSFKVAWPVSVMNEPYLVAS